MLDSLELFYDSLLGGAAMSMDDLEIIESQEIRWLFTRKDFNKDES